MGSLVQMGLANALLAGMLALVALVVQRYSRRPALVHALWVLVLVKLITPPLVTLPIPGWRASEAVAVSEPAPVRQETPADVLPPPEIEPTTPDGPLVLRIEDLAIDPRPAPPEVMKVNAPIVPPPAPAVLLTNDPPPMAKFSPTKPVAVSSLSLLLSTVGWLWLSGAFIILVLTLWRIEQFRALLAHARLAPGALQRQAETLAARLGIRDCPDVLLLPGPVPPMLWAIGGQPKLYFPSALLARLNEQGRAALLMHELAHLARRDHWVRWLELVVGCLFWWYPVVWLTRHRLQVAEEECCDAWVTSELPDHRPAYAGALLETVDFLSRVPSPFPPAASGFGRVHQLKRRLTMIVRGSTPRGLSWAGKFVVLALAIALPLVPGRSAAPPSARAEQKAAIDSSKMADEVTPPEADSGDEPTQYQNTPRAFGGGSGGQVWQARVSPDGKTLAVVAGGTGDNEGALTLYDLPDGKERATLTESKPIRCLAYSPDGKHLATGDFNMVVKLRDPKTGEVKQELKGHTGAINGVVFTPDNKHLISASLDKTLKVWEVATGKDTQTLTGHTDWVLHVSISPDGKSLISASRDMTARVWDVPEYKTRHVLKGHTSWVEGCACSPDNKTVATFGLENMVKLWDAKTGKHIRDLSGHTSGVLHGFFLDAKTLVTSSHDQRAIVWDVETGNARQTLSTGHTTSVYAVAATKDGKTLVTGSWDKNVKLWDLTAEEEKSTLRPKRYNDENNFPLLALASSPDGKYLAASGEEKGVKILDASTGGFVHLLEGHEDIVGAVAFSPDSKTLATAGFDGLVILWDVTTGKKKETLKGHENWVFGVSFSPDGKYLASAGYDRSVRIWDTKTYKSVCTLGLERNGHRGGVRVAAWSADSKRIVTGGTDKIVRVWDVAKKELLHTLKGHEDAIRGLTFTRDGRRVISAAEDQTVRLWDLASEKQLGSYQHQNVIRGLALSPRGRSLTVVAQDGSSRVLDPSNLALRMTVFGHQNGGATCVAYSPDGRALYTGGADRAIRRYEAAVDARAPLLTFRDGNNKQMWVANYSPDGKWLATAGADKTLRVRPSMNGTRPWSLQGLDSAVYGMTVSPDGETLVTGCGDGTAKLWNLKTGTRKATLEGHKFQVWMSAFSPNGKKLAVVAGSWSEAGQPGVAKVWDLSGKEPKEIGDLPDHGSPVMALAWSKDGKTIVTGARDGSAKLIDADSLKEKHKLEGHKDATRFAAFSPEGKYVATASFDGLVKVWTVADGKEVASFKAHDRGANCVAWSADGKFLATCSRPGGEMTGPTEVKLWDVNFGENGPPKFTERATLKGHAQNVLCCAFSPDSKTLASVGGQYGQYGEAIVWDVATGKEKMLLHGHRMWCEAVTWSKDGSVLFTGGGTAGSRGEVRAWLMSPGGWEVADAHKGEVCCAAWNKDGTLLATGCTNSSIKIWDVATGKVKTELTGHKQMVRFLAFSPDGKSLASASNDKTIRLWDLDGQTEPIELTKYKLMATSVAFSPDGKWLATASADPFYKERTGDIKVFEVKTGKERTGAAWANQPALSVAYSPDGKYLATGGSGANMLKIYESESGKLIRTVNGANSIRVIAWSPDSKRVAAAHGVGSQRGNGSIQVWDINSGREVVAVVGHTTMCLGIGYSHDGRRLASASNDNTIKVWDLVGPAIPATARAMTPQPKQ